MLENNIGCDVTFLVGEERTKGAHYDPSCFGVLQHFLTKNVIKQIAKNKYTHCNNILKTFGSISGNAISSLVSARGPLNIAKKTQLRPIKIYLCAKTFVLSSPTKNVTSHCFF
jgi:CRISPR/Cas system type I-B associated protein Csh2 (Cas7 group RAMP superfamily)